MIWLKILCVVLCLIFVEAYNSGGRSAVAHPYPFMVSLQQKTNRTIFKYCSGVIVSELWVLTNSQCVDEIEQEQMLVVAGVLKAYDYDHKYSQIRNVSKIIYHQKYKYKDGEIPKFDLVMLKMNKPFIYKRNVQNVTLGTTRLVTGNGEIIGWGATQSPANENQSNDLLFTTLEVVNHDECLNYYKDIKEKFCIGNSEQTACFGDGGGPYVQYDQKTGNAIVVGLASANALPCGIKPALYTNVAYYSHFIRNTIQNE